MKKNMTTIFIVVAFLVGISVFLYPTISNYLYELNSSRSITNHNEAIAKMSKEEIAAEMDAAHRYNYSLFNNAVVLTDPFDPDAYPITDGNYDELLATDDIMAFVEIPAIKVNLPIYHHTTEDVLVKGVTLKTPHCLSEGNPPMRFCPPIAACRRRSFSPICTCLKLIILSRSMCLTKPCFTRLTILKSYFPTTARPCTSSRAGIS